MKKTLPLTSPQSKTSDPPRTTENNHPAPISLVTSRASAVRAAGSEVPLGWRWSPSATQRSASSTSRPQSTSRRGAAADQRAQRARRRAKRSPSLPLGQRKGGMEQGRRGATQRSQRRSAGGAGEDKAPSDRRREKRGATAASPKEHGVVRSKCCIAYKKTAVL